MRGISSTAWLLALASGVLQALIFPKPSLYWLSWIALAPLLVAILLISGPRDVHVLDDRGRRLGALTPGQGFLLGYACGIVWYAATCYWIFNVMHVYGALAKPVAFGVLILFCLYLALYHGLFGFLLARAAQRSGRRRLLALAVAPFLWVAVELARARITGFPWDLLGTAQVDNIPLTQIATITGVYGISFGIAVVNAAFAAGFLLPRPRRTRMLVASAAAAAILQAGVLLPVPASTATRQARLVQQNIPILEGSEWTTEFFARTMAELAQLSTSGTLPPQTPRLVIWPESPAPFYVTDAAFSAQMSEIARRADAYLVSGALGVRRLPEKRESELLNSAALITPSGNWAARYDKIHLVPFGEYVPFQSLLVFAEKLTREAGNFGRGQQRTVFSVQEHKLAAFICYESIFPDEVRLFAANGAELFVNISNDGWFGDTGAPGQHLNMARMRAIENRRWVLRATNTGITASIDPYGRVVRRAPRDVRTALDAPYDFVTSTTFYTRRGDVFAWACAIISLLAVLVRFRMSAVRFD